VWDSEGGRRDATASWSGMGVARLSLLQPTALYGGAQNSCLLDGSEDAQLTVRRERLRQASW
jgi:hypothetical protein